MLQRVEAGRPVVACGHHRQRGKAWCSSSRSSTLFRSLYPGKYPLRTYHKDMIEVFFASLDLLHDAIVRSLPHPLRAPGRHTVRPIVIRA